MAFTLRASLRLFKSVPDRFVFGHQRKDTRHKGRNTQFDPGKRIKKKNSELAGKPGSVKDSHSSGMSVAEHLKQPTQIPHGSCLWIPIWSCSEWGLPCHLCYHRRGALLPHHFNLTGPAGLRRYIFCGTFHRFTPSRRYLALYPVEPGLSSVDKNLQRLPGQLTNNFNTRLRIKD